MNSHLQNEGSTTTAVSENDCFTDRKTIGVVEGKEGAIVKLDNVNFGIRYADGGQVLMPCNLPEALCKEGLTIIFSGVLKEAGLQEMWAAQPFVLTNIARQ